MTRLTWRHLQAGRSEAIPAPLGDFDQQAALLVDSGSRAKLI